MRTITDQLEICRSYAVLGCFDIYLCCGDSGLCIWDRGWTVATVGLPDPVYFFLFVSEYWTHVDIALVACETI